MKGKSAGFIILLICIASSLTQADIIVSDGTDTIVNGSHPTGEIVLSINEFWAYRNCFGTSLDMENDVEVAALQVDILFDTACSNVTGIGITPRSKDLDIFNWAHIEGGIRIAMTGIGHSIAPGQGPVAVIFFQKNYCPESCDSWDITRAVAADPLGGEIPVSKIDDCLFPMHPEYKGDVNEDNKIDILDVVLGIRCVLGLDNDVTQQGLWAADYNGDGEINIKDIIQIVNEILGQSTCPP